MSHRGGITLAVQVWTRPVAYHSSGVAVPLLQSHAPRSLSVAGLCVHSTLARAIEHPGRRPENRAHASIRGPRCSQSLPTDNVANFFLKKIIIGSNLPARHHVRCSLMLSEACHVVTAVPSMTLNCSHAVSRNRTYHHSERVNVPLISGTSLG